MVRRVAMVTLLVTALAASWGFLVSGETRPVAPLAPDTLRQWLTVISSDEFEGRATFSPGLDKAAAYISDRLRDAGVRPGGDEGTYLQRVPVQTIQAVNRSSLVVEVNGQSRSFRNGEDVFFPANVGVKRSFTLRDVEFVGYGLNLGSIHNDYAGRNVKGKAVVWLGDAIPFSVKTDSGSRFLEARASTAIDEMGAAVSLSLVGLYRDRPTSTFVTTQRLDLPRAPDVAVSDAVLAFVFSASGINYEDLKAKAAEQEDLPRATVKGVKLTFNLDADYSVTATRITQNVIGFIDGSDPQLKNTYVAFGAHYDHLGVNQNVPEGSGIDRINNGADDDGSGTTALIGLANAYMAGPRPRRSLMFAWHAGEERGLWGSQYLADHPPVPINKIVAQLNIDMIGRNRDNKDSEENTVYAVGADRISTELHNLLITADASLSQPLNIDFEMNDPADPERIYFRSDHFSYAAKGIPIIFFFTGLHPDYHRVTDSVEKIHFEKMSHITRLVYELGLRLANLDHAPVRDFKGPRMGRGSSGKIQ
jgi:Peptidase family M28